LAERGLKLLPERGDVGFDRFKIGASDAIPGGVATALSVL
jgi:hypothetical protein